MYVHTTINAKFISLQNVNSHITKIQLILSARCGEKERGLAPLALIARLWLY